MFILVAIIAVIGVGVLWTAPRFLVPLLSARYPGCLYSVATTARAVALTIDDGPHAGTTPRLLRALRDHRAHATFFLISGNVANNDSIVAAMVEQGHEIANHLTRDEPSIDLSPTAFDSALVAAGRVLSRHGAVRWARPGGGRYSQRMLATMRQRGYQCALGSVYPYDAEIPSSRLSAAFVLAHVRPGAIIVLHDGASRGLRTEAVLNRILPELARRGFRVMTLTELATLASPLPRPR